MGAVRKIYKERYSEIREKIEPNLPTQYTSPVNFNDFSSYEDVISLCKELDI